MWGKRGAAEVKSPGHWVKTQTNMYTSKKAVKWVACGAKERGVGL